MNVSCRMIQISIDLYTRSPTAYANLLKTLKLPSCKHLVRYKNFVKQKPGIVHKNLHWMALDAKRRKVTEEGHTGFLVFDEVPIQVSGVDNALHSKNI